MPGMTNQPRSSLKIGSQMQCAVKRLKSSAGAIPAPVQTEQDGRVGPEKRLLVLRTVGESKIDYAVINARPEVPLTERVRIQRQ